MLTKLKYYSGMTINNPLLKIPDNAVTAAIGELSWKEIKKGGMLGYQLDISDLSEQKIDLYTELMNNNGIEIDQTQTSQGIPVFRALGDTALKIHQCLLLKESLDERTALATSFEEKAKPSSNSSVQPRVPSPSRSPLRP